MAIKKAVKPNPDDLESLEGYSDHLHALRTEAKTLKEDIDMAQGELLGEMERLKLSEHTYRKDGKSYKVLRQQTETLVIDQTKLAKRLGAKLWAKVSTRSMDKAKLDAYVKSGEVKPADIAACSSWKQSSAFVKITG